MNPMTDPRGYDMTNIARLYARLDDTPNVRQTIPHDAMVAGLLRGYEAHSRRVTA